MQPLPRSKTGQALADEYAVLGEVIGSLAPHEVEQTSGCRGWINSDLIYHMLQDAQRALIAFHTPADPPADRDYIGYWEGWSADDVAARDHARFVRISAAAHRDPKMICGRWLETSKAAIGCFTHPLPDYIPRQGHVLAITDFIATLVVEAAIHHLDLIKNLESKPKPAPSAVSLTVPTLDGLLAMSRPPHWGDETYLLKGTGRQKLDEQDTSALGTAAQRFPLLS